jgi:hypothetical protein
MNQRRPRLCGYINQVAHFFSNFIVAIGLQITPYDSDIIKKIFVGANLCNNENKINDMSCVQIGSILLKIKEPKDHVRVPQGFPRVRDTFLSSSKWPQVHPITKSQCIESPSPVRFLARVQLRIQEQTTLKLILKSHTTSK